MFMLLLKEVAGNFPSCQMLKEDYVRDNVQNPLQRNRNQNRREESQLARPARDPTEEEIEGVMSFVGYDRDTVIYAIQMANFDLMTAQNLLLDNPAGILAFGEQ